MTTTSGAPAAAEAAAAAAAASSLLDQPARLVVDSPVGPLVLAGHARALTHILLPTTEMAAHGSTAGPSPEPLVQAAGQLVEYFAGARRSFDLALELAGTPFQVAVWRALGAIGYGDTITYAQLAEQVGRPGAFRAVGQANGANPLPIVFPCHRVVASGGRLGGYGGGLAMKRRLLALEGSPLASAR